MKQETIIKEINFLRSTINRQSEMKIYILLIFLFTGFVSRSQQDKLSFYRVDTLKSKVFWKCDKHNGLIKLQVGGFVLENEQLVGGIFVIDMHSIKDLDMDPKQYGTAIMILENTLKNEFFEADTYPYAIFKLEDAYHLSGDMYQLIGDFTMHGITNCISFKARIKVDGDTLTMTSERFSIDRTDWGIYRMSPKRPYQDDENGWTVQDEVDLKIELIAIRE